MTRSISMLAYPDAQILDVVGPLQTFVTASAVSGADAYRIEILARQAGPFRTTSGLRLEADRAFLDLDERALDAIDTLMISGGEGSRPHLHGPETFDFIRRAAAHARRVASVCTGSFLLAEAGVLDGKRAATHWALADTLAERYPAVEADGDAIFVRDGKVWTSAGVTAGMDLALALIEEDLGRAVALDVARQQVMYMARPGGQSQFSSELYAQATDTGRLGALIQWIVAHPAERLTVDRLAERAAMSERTFARAFVAETGTTPARFVEKVRLDAARRLLGESRHPTERVAVLSGFSGAEQMRRTFLRHLGVTPQDYRRRFSGTPSPAQPRRQAYADWHSAV